MTLNLSSPCMYSVQVRPNLYGYLHCCRRCTLEAGVSMITSLPGSIDPIWPYVSWPVMSRLSQLTVSPLGKTQRIPQDPQTLCQESQYELSRRDAKGQHRRSRSVDEPRRKNRVQEETEFPTLQRSDPCSHMILYSHAPELLPAMRFCFLPLHCSLNLAQLSPLDPTRSFRLTSLPHRRRRLRRAGTKCSDSLTASARYPSASQSV